MSDSRYNHSTQSTRAALAAKQLSALKEQEKKLNEILNEEKKQYEAKEQNEHIALQKEWYHAAKIGDVATLKKLFPIVIDNGFVKDSCNSIMSAPQLNDPLSLFKYAKYCALQNSDINTLLFLSTALNEKWPYIRWLSECIFYGDINCIAPHTYSQNDGFLGFSYYNKIEMHPLMYAIQKKDEKLANFLINHLHIREIEDPYRANKRSRINNHPFPAAIANHLTSAAIALIEKKIELTICDDIPDDEETYDLSVHQKSSSLNLTLLMLAAKYNNKEVVHCLLKKDADAASENDWGKAAIDLTTSEEIKQLILSYYSNHQRLKYIHFTGDIPKHLLCPMSNKIIERPVFYQGAIFCKKAFLEYNYGGTARPLVGPDKNTIISHDQFNDITDLAVDQTLKAELHDFMQQAMNMKTSTVKQLRNS